MYTNWFNIRGNRRGAITRLLKKAIKEVSKLPEDDQEAIAAWLLGELAAEREWDKSFAESQDVLAALADEALAEHRAGVTKELNPDKL